MTRKSDIIKLIRTYGQGGASGAANAGSLEVDIGAVTTAVRSALTGQFLPRSEFDTHRQNRSAHHLEVHNILGSQHTVTGAQYSVIGLTGTNALGLLTSTSDARTTPNVLLRTDSAGNVAVSQLTTLELASGDANAVNINIIDDIKSPDYASQTTGWRITRTGDGDFRYVYMDEAHVRVFYADLTRALAGVEWIMKSVAELSDAWIVPAAGASTSIYLQDHRAMPGVALFDPGDTIGVPFFSQSGGGLVVGFVYGTVSNYTALSGGGLENGRQKWTFVRSTGSNAGSLAAGTVIAAGAPALDFGVSGNGYIEINAIDGSSGVNAPYMQVVRWTGHPATGKKTVVRLGNLAGLGFAGEDGLYVAGPATGQYLKGSGTDFTLQNITQKSFLGVNQTYELTPAGTLRIGQNLASPATTSLVLFAIGQDYGGGTYSQGDLIVGDPTAANWLWDYSEGRIKFREGTTTRAYIDTDGSMRAGAGNWLVDVDGQNMQQDDAVAPTNARAIQWWASIETRSGTPTQFIDAFFNSLNQNILRTAAKAQGSIYEAVNIMTARPWTGSDTNWKVYSDGTAGLELSTTQRIELRALAASNDIYVRDTNLGNNVRGSGIFVGRNSNAGAAGPAPGWIALMSPNGTWNYFWCDDSGNLRKATTDPTGSTGSATRNANSHGTVV